MLTATFTAGELPPPGVGLTAASDSPPAIAWSAAESVANSFVELTKLVERASPFTCTIVVGTNPVPVTVSRVEPAVPATTVLGETDIVPGVGLFTASDAELDTPPPGPGFTAVMASIPALARSPCVSATLTEVALTYVVGRVAPFTNTVVPATNPVPVTATVALGAPTCTVEGTNAVTVGDGFVTINGAVPEAPPPGCGLLTFISSVPAVVRSVAGSDTVSWVSLTYVVVRGLPFTVVTTPETKFVPVIVTFVLAEPISVAAGARVVTVGIGLSTCSVVAVLPFAVTVEVRTASARTWPVCNCAAGTVA